MLKKPGKHKKQKAKMPKPPQEKYCRRCNRETYKERWCHAESRNIKFLDGGGIMAGRINHKYIAWLCMECDLIMSQPLAKDASLQQLKQHEREWQRLIDLST